MRIKHNMDATTKRLSIVLERYIKRVEQQVDDVILKQAVLLLSDIKYQWPVDTGLSRAAWQGPNRVGHAHYEVVNPVVYAAIIEYGGFRGVGPKTVRVSGANVGGGIRINSGIYASQSPAAPVRRSLAARIVDLKAELAKAVA